MRSSGGMYAGLDWLHRGQVSCWSYTEFTWSRDKDAYRQAPAEIAEVPHSQKGIAGFRTSQERF